MNEKLKQWSLIAEIIGGLGVLVTLIILIFEVRANSDLTRTVAYQQEIKGFNEWRSTMVDDPNQIRIFGSYNRRENVPEQSSDDGLILTFILTSLFSSYESAFYAEQSDILGDAQWSRVELSLCRAYQRAKLEPPYWNEIAFRLSDEFSEFIVAEC